MDLRIAGIEASEVLDSRGSPAVAVDVMLADGTIGQAMVPSGASWINEPIDLRDGDKKRFGGKGVLRAVEHVRTKIANALKGVDASDQRGIDLALIATATFNTSDSPHVVKHYQVAGVAGCSGRNSQLADHRRLTTGSIQVGRQ